MAWGILRSPPKADERARITSVRFSHPRSDQHAYVLSGDPLDVHIGYEAKERVDDVVAVVAVHDLSGRILFVWRSDYYTGFNGPLEGRGELVFTFEMIPLLDGNYTTFGKVTAGLDVARRIYAMPVIERDGVRYPEKPAIIKKVVIQTRVAEAAK